MHFSNPDRYGSEKIKEIIKEIQDIGGYISDIAISDIAYCAYHHQSHLRSQQMKIQISRVQYIDNHRSIEKIFSD